eukprot:scaffold32476_cov64-Phaeocystis_antarctica.AAC.1
MFRSCNRRTALRSHQNNCHCLSPIVKFRLNLLSAPPPTPSVPPGTILIRVAASLQPAKGQRPPASAWAME